MRLALVDLSAVWWTNWHATSDSQLSAAYDNTLRMIGSVAANHDQTVICLDSPKSRRKEMEPSYKAQREPKPKAALEQARRLLAELKKRWPCYQIDGLEGDDVIATFVGRMDEIKGLYNPRRRFGEYEFCDGLELVIVGCDKDFWQLLGDCVSMWNFSTGQAFAAADLMAKHGIEPRQAVDWQALVGDAADNLPGVKGCGPKTATKLLQQFGSATEVLDAAKRRPTEFGGKKQLLFNLQESSDLIYRNLELMRLVVDQEMLIASDHDKLLELMRLVVDQEMPFEAEWVKEEREAIEWVAEQEQKETAMKPSPLPPQPPPQPEPEPEPAPSQPQAPPARKSDRAMVVGQSADFTRALEPMDMRQLAFAAAKFHESRLYQRKFRNADEIVICAMAGRERGLGLFSSLANIHIIEGQPAFSSHILVGFARQHPDCEWFRMVESTDQSATFETKRRGSPQAETCTYTIDDAKQAGVWRSGGNWAKRPKQMLRKQAAVELARAVYQDACAGLYCPEELTGGETWVQE